MNIYNIIKSESKKYEQLIFDTYNYIWKNPETGYKEYKTSEYLKNVFENLGYKLNLAKDIPGFYTVIDTGKEGPEVLILGELDSLICNSHPDSDKTTGAVHSCGHCAQCAALVGVAAILKNPDILSKLCGRIRLCAVPAEELIELEYRNSLINKGIIKYCGGKQEFLQRGYFDDVNIAFMVHTTSDPNFSVKRGAVGCISKKITYLGKAAHAGGSPYMGINALYAATEGINAANALREKFMEKDVIRFHPIITNGGYAVNAIPEKVEIDAYVRGSSFEGMIAANKEINRALCGGALSIGANVDIKDNPGYSPYINNQNLINAAGEALTELYPQLKMDVIDVISSGSSDIGDLCNLMPMAHFNVPGAVGSSHGNDYYVDDIDSACVKSAQWQIATVVKLLSNNGEIANKIISEYEPKYSLKEEYLEFLDSIKDEGQRIEYIDKDKAIVRL